MNHLAIEHLSKTYRGGVQALRDVTISVNKGEVLMHGQWSSPVYTVANGQPQVIFPIPGRVTAYYVATPDLNNDGKPDLAVADFLGQHVSSRASGRAPKAWTPERFAGLQAMPRTGWDSVTVPGAVSAWVALS